MNRPAWLTRLLENGSLGFSAANRGQLAELLGLGIVSIRSAGLRRTIVVADSDQLAQWLQARYPTHPIDPDRLATRGGNIVRRGGSKVGRHAHEVLPLPFKWFGDGQDRLTRITRDFGLAAALTDRLAGLALPERWHLLTIENWEPFLQADYTAAPAPVMVAYLGGNVSDAVLKALDTFGSAPLSVLHFGDYDWEGLYIFQRLQRFLPAARLYIPPDIATLFADFGDRRLIERQIRKAAFDMHDRACRPVVELMARFNAGLEQEIVGLPRFSDLADGRHQSSQAVP